MSDNEVIVTIESTLLDRESTRKTLGIVGNSAKCEGPCHG
jgi:hypothetical protein